MTITLVLPFVNLTGGVRLLLEYANWLHDEGHHVTVVHPLWPYRFHFSRRDRMREFRKALLRRSQVSWMPVRCRLLRVPFIANAFLPKADLIVATAWPVAEDVARLDASRGRKVQIVFHHEYGTGPEDRIAATYRLPLHRLSFAASVRGSMRERFSCEIDQVIPAGIDPSRFFPDGTRRTDMVLMLYHDDPRKGAADGIGALTSLRSRRPDLDIRLCGTVRPKALPSWIRFEFHPDDVRLRRLYSESTAFLYPSRHEGFGLPPLEAMACGCPVVTTDVGAVPEFATHGHNAMIVGAGDVEGMARALESLLSDPELRERLSVHGLETAQRWAIARSAPLFRDALERAATSAGTDAGNYGSPAGLHRAP